MIWRLLLAMLLLPVSTHATVFVNSGFESNPIENEGWSFAQGWCFFPPQTVRQNPCPEIDRSTDIAFSGSASLKQTYNAAWSDPNPQTHTQEIAQLPGVMASAGTHIWVTYRYRTVNFTYTSVSSTKQVYYKNSQNTAPTWVSNFFWGERSPGMSVQGLADLCPTNPGSGVGQSCNLYPNMAPSQPLQNNVWYCIEEHIKFNTPGVQDGNVEIFTNGVQTLGYYNIKWLNNVAMPTNASSGGCCNGWNVPTTVIDKVALYKQNGDGIRYFDDFVVSDTRIGCGATPPPPPDTQAPASVTGLQASAVAQTQINLSWTATTDQGGSGLAGYNIRRCTGVGCTPSAIVSSPGPSTTFTSITNLTANTTYGFSINAFDGASPPNQNTYSATVYATTPAAPSAEPVIASATPTSSALTFTHGTTTPTQIRRAWGSNDGLINGSQTYDFAEVSSLVITRTLPPGVNWECLFAINSAGVENSLSSAYRCNNVTGLGQTIDTDPPELSNGLPTAELPAGTTSTPISVTLNKSGNVSCRYHNEDTEFSSMPSENIMTLAGLVASATVAGLMDDSSTLFYVRCLFVDQLGVEHPNTSSVVIQVDVAASTADTTPPSDVQNLACTALSQAQARCTWDPATDDDAVSGYQVYLSFGADNINYELAGSPTSETITLVSIPPNTVVNIVVKALDASLNPSEQFSNVSTITTTNPIDVEPPSDMTNLRVVSVFARSIVVTFDPGTDDRGPITAILEACVGAGCSNFSVIASQSVSMVTIHNLQPQTVYRLRGKFGDSMNVSVNYSETIDVETRSDGLTQPRLSVFPLQNRAPSVPSAAGARQPRQ